jgi:FkbM family methyltransferase
MKARFIAIHLISSMLFRMGRTPKEFRRHVSFLKRMQARGHVFKNVLDIGANQGKWSLSAKARVLRDSHFVLIEPNPKYFKSLNKIGQTLSLVLSDESKIVKFYTNGGTGDSYYLEQTGHYLEQDAEEMQAHRLDQLKEVPEIIDLIKIDTQGSEVDILSGFGERLSSCKAVIAEVSLYEYNRGAPRFSDVVEFMASKGFSVVEILDEHYHSGRLVAVDLAFLNRAHLSKDEASRAIGD